VQTEHKYEKVATEQKELEEVGYPVTVFDILETGSFLLKTIPKECGDRNILNRFLIQKPLETNFDITCTQNLDALHYGTDCTEDYQYHHPLIRIANIFDMRFKWTAVRHYPFINIEKSRREVDLRKKCKVWLSKKQHELWKQLRSLHLKEPIKTD
jgi:hypothetical protein